jgi:hypothetical protein
MPLSSNIVYRMATDSITPVNVGITPAPLPHETVTFGGRRRAIVDAAELPQLVELRLN